LSYNDVGLKIEQGKFYLEILNNVRWKTEIIPLKIVEELIE